MAPAPRPEDWPTDAEWPPHGHGDRLPERELPATVPGADTAAGERALTWSLTLLGPLVLWAAGFWLVGLAQPDRRDPECVGFCLTPREEVWFVGMVYGLAAVPVATVVGAVVVALVAPERRLAAAVGVLTVDVLVLAMVAGGLAEAAPG